MNAQQQQLSGHPSLPTDQPMLLEVQYIPAVRLQDRGCWTSLEPCSILLDLGVRDADKICLEGCLTHQRP